MHKNTHAPTVEPNVIKVSELLYSILKKKIDVSATVCVVESLLPSQTCHTVNSHAASWILLKLLLQEIQPIINKFTGGGGSIVKWPILRQAKTPRLSYKIIDLESVYL